MKIRHFVLFGIIIIISVVSCGRFIRGDADTAAPVIDGESGGVTVESFTIASKYLGATKRIDVFLPPEYYPASLSFTIKDKNPGISNVYAALTISSDKTPVFRKVRTYSRLSKSVTLKTNLNISAGNYRFYVYADDMDGNVSRTNMLEFTVEHRDIVSYPAICFNDGQDMEQLGLKKTLEKLYATGEMVPVIAIAVPAGDRMNEYGVSLGGKAILCEVDKGSIQGRKTDIYEMFIINELMPTAVSNYRIVNDPKRTAIWGASLGGLSAFSIAWNHPERFGIAGVFSGSFWWREKAGTVDERQNSRIMQRVVRESASKPAVRFWFETGSKDETSDRDSDGIIDSIDDTKDLIREMESKGYVENIDYIYFDIEGGFHSYPTWSVVLPNFLKWAYPAK